MVSLLVNDMVSLLENASPQRGRLASAVANFSRSPAAITWVIRLPLQVAEHRNVQMLKEQLHLTSARAHHSMQCKNVHFICAFA